VLPLRESIIGKINFCTLTKIFFLFSIKAHIMVLSEHNSYYCISSLKIKCAKKYRRSKPTNIPV